MVNVTRSLVNFAVDTNFEDLPRNVVHEAKRCLLDCIGCALAAANTDKGKLAIQLARRMGGKPESTIIGAGDKLSAWSAAFANSELINALDFDVGSEPHHSPPCLIPSSLALAESAGAGGKDLILAFVVGAEISSRLAAGLPSTLLANSESGNLELAPGHGHGCCSIGGAAGAGKILKLDREKMSHAFGIAAFAAPVPTYARWCMSPPVPMTKYAFVGWTAMAGLTSALLAETGYTGDDKVLDGEYGFWRFHSNDRDSWIPRKVTGQLGRQWFWMRTRQMYKPYPACGIYMTSLAGFISLIDENSVLPEEVESIKVRLAIPLLDEPATVWHNRDIKSSIDAQFSAPYLFSAAVHGIRDASMWQDPQTIKDSRILKFMDKVTIGAWPECPDLAEGGPCSLSYSIDVIAKGKTYKKEKIYTKEESVLLGKTWMPDDELIRKFKDNAARRLPRAKVDKAASLIWELEKVENVAELMNCLVV